MINSIFQCNNADDVQIKTTHYWEFNNMCEFLGMLFMDKTKINKQQLK